MPLSHDPRFGRQDASALKDAIIQQRGSVGNPLLAMWRCPRRTVREMLDTGNHDPEVALSAVAGGCLTLGLPVYLVVPYVVSGFELMLRGFFIGTLVGIALLWLMTRLLLHLGHLLGGSAEDFEARCAWGWSLVPMVSACLLTLPALVLLKNGFYVPDPLWAREAPWLHYGVPALHGLQLLGLLWTLAAMTGAQQETQKIPLALAALSVALSLGITAMPAALILVACRIFQGP